MPVGLETRSATHRDRYDISKVTSMTSHLRACDVVLRHQLFPAGSFIFERGIDVTSPRVPELGHVGREKEVVCPRFLLADSLKQELTRQDTKEDIRRQHISGSVFQTKKMT